MSPSLAFALARPSSRADRGRFLLIACSTSVAGALLIAAQHIARIPAHNGTDGSLRLSQYATEGGLRAGVVIATLLLTVPVLALAVQALRVGSFGRDRRMAALRLAGATPADVRTFAAAEAGAAAIIGALLSGPAYLLLWVIVGVLPPGGARMLDAPNALDGAAWLALVLLGAVAGALAGMAIHGRAIVEPLGVYRRGAPPRPGRVSRWVLCGGFGLLLAAGVAFPSAATDGAGEVVLIVLMMLGMLLVAFSGGERLVVSGAKLLARRRGAVALLASRRLRADPRSSGRVAGVLLVCGIALSVEGRLVSSQLLDGFNSGDSGFYLVGYTMAALAVLVAAVVALVTLLIGAADGLLDARRPLATLGALGVDEALLVRVLARQIVVTSVPAIMLGALIGGSALALLGTVNEGSALRLLAPGAITALVAGLAMWSVARVAAHALRPMIRAAIDPENLRVA